MQGTTLDAESFGFLVEPGFQSSEYSDVDDANHLVVDEPAFRSEKVFRELGYMYQ
jgi:hypothetical protein